ncbi:MAG: hypothetical protein EA377_03375 [Phycisphaerales bacterium]|nr:MAG: hypothetical protein EA377_03375 [Phycisphaerales bacterium]
MSATMVESKASSAVWMLLGALLFGYIGFSFIWPVGTPDDPNWIAIVLMWTMRLTAIGFALSFVLVFPSRAAGEWTYAVTGLLSAIFCAIVLGWGFLPDTHHPLNVVLLVLFTVMNGFISIQHLMQLMAARRMKPDNEYAAGFSR